jgi:hypothetical protein
MQAIVVFDQLPPIPNLEWTIKKALGYLTSADKNHQVCLHLLMAPSYVTHSLRPLQACTPQLLVTLTPSWSFGTRPDPKVPDCQQAAGRDLVKSNRGRKNYWKVRQVASWPARTTYTPLGSPDGSASTAMPLASAAVLSTKRPSASSTCTRAPGCAPNSRASAVAGFGYRLNPAIAPASMMPRTDE